MNNTTNTETGAGVSAAHNFPQLAGMLSSLFGYGASKKRTTSRTKLFAVMPDGTERAIYKSRGSGWNLPEGSCFTSHLDCAKRQWIDAGAVKFIRK